MKQPRRHTGRAGPRDLDVPARAVRVHPAPQQMVSLSCAWPLSKGGQRVGEPVLAEWLQDVMPNLPDEWQFFTVLIYRFN